MLRDSVASLYQEPGEIVVGPVLPRLVIDKGAILEVFAASNPYYSTSDGRRGKNCIVVSSSDPHGCRMTFLVPTGKC